MCSGVSDTVGVRCGVPQGSVLGPLLFTAYTSPVERLITSFGIQHIAYADDISLYVNMKGSNSTLSVINDCSSAVSAWFMSNDLLLNATKSEAMYTGTRQQVNSVKENTITVAGTEIKSACQVKLLGVTLDASLNFDRHVTDVCKSSFYHIKALRHIRKCVDISTANTIACSLVASKLDYCNSVLAGMSDHNVNRLQRVQNAAARAVTQSHRRASSSKILHDLHWLPVSARIDYKIALLTFKILNNCQPLYLFSELHVVKPVRTLRSASAGVLLSVPFTKTVFASRAFSVYAPRLWNSLSVDLRNCVSNEPGSVTYSVQSFKRLLKTHLFTRSFVVDVV